MRRVTTSIVALALAALVTNVPFLNLPARAEPSPSRSENIRPWHPRPDRARPIVAVVGLTMGTETTDFIIPWAVLTQSGVADVFALGTEAGPIQMMPALKIQPQMTIDEFDARFTAGTDYLVIPAVHDPINQRLIEWVRAQAHKGATVMTICDGAWVAANAGVLDEHRATGHWYSLPSLEKKFTGTTWIRDRRYVSDGPVVTTTGVTASIPASIALVEAIAGHEKAEQTAQALGITDWSPSHHTDDFHFTARDYLLVARNELSFWSHQTVGIRVSPETDEIALALIADAYSRTWRSQALSVADSQEPLHLRRGLTLIPDSSKPLPQMLPPFDGQHPVDAINWALSGISQAYGEHTANHVALQMEFPNPAFVDR